MKKKQASPYSHLKDLPEWRVLEKAVGELVKNGDIAEQTPRGHIVGYLVEALRKKGK